MFITTNDKNLYAKVNNQQRQVTGVNDWRDAQWHHAVMTVSDQSSNNYRLYVDGTLKNQNTMPALSNGSASLKLGIEGDGTGNRLKGMIDDVRIYNRVLTSGEVGTLLWHGNGDFVTVRTGNQVTIKKAGTYLQLCPGHQRRVWGHPDHRSVTVSKARLPLRATTSLWRGQRQPPDLVITGLLNGDNEST